MQCLILLDRPRNAEDMRRKTTQRKEVMGANKNPYDKTYLLKGRTLETYLVGMKTLSLNMNREGTSLQCFFQGKLIR